MNLNIRCEERATLGHDENWDVSEVLEVVVLEVVVHLLPDHQVSFK